MKTILFKHYCVYFTILFSVLFIGLATLAQGNNKNTSLASFANKETANETGFLRAVIDNETIISAPVAVSGQMDLPSLLIYPSTDKNYYSIKVKSGVNESAGLIIADKAGKIVKYEEVFMTKGENYFTGSLENLCLVITGFSLKIKEIFISLH